ncbi:S8 family serine peptidase [Xanthovirga aplysinae]|uniref:S8 family serine peptidase n=1 Tax=Xanthovirga aplysinae TaxID=2529853 RepID=UPI001657168D|nr:S8 family serine peptidase [Xanthovirga aplysinae]
MMNSQRKEKVLVTLDVIFYPIGKKFLVFLLLLLFPFKGGFAQQNISITDWGPEEEQQFRENRSKVGERPYFSEMSQKTTAKRSDSMESDCGPNDYTEEELAELWANVPAGYNFQEYLWFDKNFSQKYLQDNCWVEDGNDINMQYIWNNQIEGSEEMVVAFIDSGINFDYTDAYGNKTLDRRRWVNEDEIAGNGIDDDENGYIDDVYGYNFFYDSGDPDVLYSEDNSSHGTYLANIFGASGEGNRAGVGIDRKAKIMDLVVFPKYQDGNFACDCIADAIRYAVDNGAKVINMSLGQNGTPFPTSLDNLSVRTVDEELDNAISYAWNKGAILVNVAGNMYDIGSEKVILKNHYSLIGSQPELLTVGGIELGYMASNLFRTMPGRKAELVTFDAISGQGSGTVTKGTSNAAAAMSAMISLFWGNHPELENWEVKKRLLEVANDNIFNSGFDHPWSTENGIEDLGDIDQPVGSGYQQLTDDQEGWDQHYGYGFVDLQDLWGNNKKRELEVNPENGSVNGYERPVEFAIEDLEEYDEWYQELVDEQEEVILSIEEKVEETGKVYPNPFQNKVFVPKGKYRIRGVFGEIHKVISSNGNDHLYVGELQAGMYFIEGEGNVYRVIKK